MGRQVIFRGDFRLLFCLRSLNLPPPQGKRHPDGSQTETQQRQTGSDTANDGVNRPHRHHETDDRLSPIGGLQNSRPQSIHHGLLCSYINISSRLYPIDPGCRTVPETSNSRSPCLLSGWISICRFPMYSKAVPSGRTVRRPPIRAGTRTDRPPPGNGQRSCPSRYILASVSIGRSLSGPVGGFFFGKRTIDRQIVVTLPSQPSRI